jgi:hypothetical protein
MRTTQETVKAKTTTQASEKAKSNVRLGKYALNMRITISTVFCCWQALQLLFLCQHNMEAQMPEVSCGIRAWLYFIFMACPLPFGFP